MIPGTARVSTGHEIALGRGAPHVTSSGEARRNCEGFGMVSPEPNAYFTRITGISQKGFTILLWPVNEFV